jgi:hypothetical protein
VSAAAVSSGTGCDFGSHDVSGHTLDTVLLTSDVGGVEMLAHGVVLEPTLPARCIG